MHQQLPINQFNIWLDLGGPTLLILVFVGMYIGDFSMKVITGRARKRYIDWEWPVHSELPCCVRRKAHLTLVIGMILLMLTGLYIRFPFQLPIGNRMAVKYLHYAVAIVLTVLFIFRICYAFLHPNKDYRELAITKKDIKVLIPTLKYYGFLAHSKPHVANYNPLQKSTYGYMIPIFLFLQIVTGYALIFSTQSLGWIAPHVGGLAMARAYVRISHYALNWFFIVFMVSHIYLALTEDLPAFLYFFFNIKPWHGGHDE